MGLVASGCRARPGEGPDRSPCNKAVIVAGCYVCSKDTDFGFHCERGFKSVGNRTQLITPRVIQHAISKIHVVNWKLSSHEMVHLYFNTLTTLKKIILQELSLVSY
jgi:hypothetical protein